MLGKFSLSTNRISRPQASETSRLDPPIRKPARRAVRDSGRRRRSTARIFDARGMTPPRPGRVMPAHPALSDSGAMIEEKGPAAYLAEFVGTLVLVLAITGFVSASVFATRLDLLGLAIVHGLALMGIVYTIGSISGAHVNPAVTLALVSIRKITGRDAGFYILAQFLGAIVGAWLAKEFFLGRGSL